MSIQPHAIILKTATLLTRRPLITQVPTPFADAYYAYHADLRAAQSRVVINDFWTKKGAGRSLQIDMKEGAPRRTLADKQSDHKSLERLLDQPLFLLVKSGLDRWMLPSGTVLRDEPLHKAAERNVVESVGNSVQFWMVGKAPIAVLNAGSDKRSKTFIHKAHILAGRSIPVSSNGIKDFVWVSKSEASKYLDKDMYTDLVDLL